MMSLLVATAFAAGVSCALPATEIARQVSLPYATFDTMGPPYGWRYLSGAGCTDAAVGLLEGYANANARDLNPSAAMELPFHIGQVLALAGRERDSIAYFEQSVARGGDEWRTYVAATIAFLKRDADVLASARARYASLAPESVRLRFIDGFIACPNEPYAKAVHCAMGH
jgi:hypothetical protein